ncbi:MAG: hypothetical protein HUU37_03410 [Bdellovibrionales bacterium]|nr:hypothetical protein [Bdellovibrionales bacterium]
MKGLNAQLSRGNLVAITYKTKRFMTGSNQTHVSSVMARRWKNGSCQYLVRNSWGKGCSNYADGVECDGEAGAFWANEADLKASLIQTNWIP